MGQFNINSSGYSVVRFLYVGIDSGRLFGRLIPPLFMPFYSFWTPRKWPLLGLFALFNLQGADNQWFINIASLGLLSSLLFFFYLVYCTFAFD